MTAMRCTCFHSQPEWTQSAEATAAGVNIACSNCRDKIFRWMNTAHRSRSRRDSGLSCSTGCDAPVSRPSRSFWPVGTPRLPPCSSAKLGGQIQSARRLAPRKPGSTLIPSTRSLERLTDADAATRRGSFRVRKKETRWLQRSPPWLRSHPGHSLFPTLLVSGAVSPGWSSLLFFFF